MHKLNLETTMFSSQSIKALLIGDKGTGKTNLFTRICKNRFIDAHKPTIGAGFHTISEANLQIWDTGSYSIKFITSYAKNTNVVLAVFALDDLQSLLNLEKNWLPKIKETLPEVEIILVGNKCDLTSTRCITPEQIQEVKERNDITHHVNVSAKDNEGIDELKTMLFDNARTLSSETESDDENFIEISVSEAMIHEKPKAFKAYTKIWNRIESADEDKATALLKDYSKGTKRYFSTLSVLAHGHFARHHKTKVRAIVTKLSNYDIRLEDALAQLKEDALATDGSLARRIDFIEQQLGKK